MLFQTIFLAHILFSIPVQLPSPWQSFIHLQSVGIKIQSCFSLLGPTYRNLPPHPNVCPVLGAFADNTPCLPDARNSYSAALPRQYGEGCFGRNRTMFFVMPRLGYCFWIFGCITERFAFISPLFFIQWANKSKVYKYAIHWKFVDFFLLWSTILLAVYCHVLLIFRNVLVVFHSIVCKM